MNCCPYDKWNPTPKGVGCEGTRYNKSRPRLFLSVRDEDNLKRSRQAIKAQVCYEAECC
jgi:hypothetical protein